MKRIRRVQCITLATSIIVFAATNAIAQTTTTAPSDPQPVIAPLPPEPEGLTFSPFLGLGFAGDFENSPTAFGAALGYGMNPNVSVEGEVAFVSRRGAGHSYAI